MNRKARGGRALQTAAVNPNESMLAVDGMHCAACAPTIEPALRGVPRRARCARQRRRAVRHACAGTPGATRGPALVARRPRAGYGAVPDTAAAARALRAAARSARRAVAPVRRRLLHDAGDDVRHAGLRRAAGELAPDIEAPAALGALAADACRCCCSRRGRSSRGAWRDLRAAPHRHGRAGGAGHRDRLRRQHRRDASIPAAPFGARGLLRLADDVRLLPARRALAGAARAPSRRAARSRQRWRRLPRAVRARCAPTAASRRVALRQPARRRRGARAAGRGLSGRRRARCDGATQVDEALLTGESRAVSRKRPGDAVVAGSLNLAAPVVHARRARRRRHALRGRSSR